MKKFFIIFLSVFVIALVGCGGGGGGATPSAPTISDISQLPKATGPMASLSMSISKNLSFKAATTGLNLWTTTSSSFNSDSSRGACEMFNVVKGGIGSSMQADMIMCFVAYMSEQEAFQNLTDGDGNAVDIYDGQYHVFNLNVTSGENIPNRIKMINRKNSDGSIDLFEMFMCGGDEGSREQNEYVKKEISGSDVTMRSLGQYSDSEGSGWHSVAVVGTLDSSGAFTSKTVVERNKGEWGGSGNLGWQESTLSQFPGTFSFSGYRYGSWTDGLATGVYSDALYGYGEMLKDSSTDLSLLAMGDGAAQYYSEGTWDDGGGNSGTWGPELGTEAWNGDTTKPVNPEDSEYYDEANNGTVPTPETSEISFSFAESESWDCTDDVGSGIVDLPEMTDTEIMAACADYVPDHDWVNCWQAIPDSP